MPQFKEIRWFSLFYCVSYIIEYKEYLDQYHLYHYNLIQEKYDWQYIHSILKTFEIFIKKLENDGCSVADIFPNLQNTLKQLNNINEIYNDKNNSNIAVATIDSLLTRFSSTVKLTIPILGFLLTGQGLRYMNKKSDDAIISKEAALDTFNEYMKNNPDIGILSNFLIFFLMNRNNTLLISKQTTYDSFNFWKKIERGETFWLIEPPLLKYHPEFKGVEKKFAKYAIEILTIPASETPCERAFSHLSDILLNDKRNLDYEMLNALLIIRMNAIFLKQDGNGSHIFINHDFDQIIKSDLEKEELEYEDDPLINF